jgi:predicted Zn-dependent peptidase
MAHFIEHMAFKGTRKRKTFHVINYLESVGGDVNAYTTKEKTCFYVSMLAEYFDRATELLTDITFDSVFPDKEIIKEKQVISEEIDMYRDTPDEAILEDFDLMVYPDHSLGHPILGTRDSISQFTRDEIMGHIRESYAQGQVVFGVVGNVSRQALDLVIRKYLAPLQLPAARVRRTPPATPAIQDQVVEIATDQAHEILGGRAYAARKGHFAAFGLLTNLLGGPAMNSRLNMNVREKYGLTYNIHAFYQPFTDTGMWGIYYACDTDNIARIRKLVHKELKQLCEMPLGPIHLSQAKKQLIGQLTLSHESLLSQMLNMSKEVLDFDHMLPFEQYIAEIEAIEAKDIQAAAQEIFESSPISTITYRPT